MKTHKQRLPFGTETKIEIYSKNDCPGCSAHRGQLYESGCGLECCPEDASAEK